jgi:hypothetical protein
MTPTRWPCAKLSLSVALAREDRDVDAEHKAILVDVLVAIQRKRLLRRAGDTISR